MSGELTIGSRSATTGPGMAHRRRRTATWRTLVLGWWMLLAVGCLVDLGSGPFYGRFAIAPTFQSANAVLVPVSEVLVTLTLVGDSVPTLDTVIAIAQEDSVVDLTISVLLLTVADTYDLTLLLRNALGDTVFRGGPVPVKPSSSVSAETTPVPVSLRYTGIGFDAERVQIVTADTSLFFGETTEFSAVATTVIFRLPR